MAAMTGASSFRDSVRSLLEERALDAAVELIATEGWGQMRMVDVGARVGVSRQTLYNVFGSKQGLGEALVMREADRFLAAVVEELRRHDDPADALAAAVGYSLGAAGENNPL